MNGCGAPEQSGQLPAGVDLVTETVLAGTVTAAGSPVGGAYVRLLDAGGEFTAEVVSSPEGQFRFYAAPGQWTVRALHRTGTGQTSVLAGGPGLHSIALAVS